MNPKNQEKLAVQGLILVSREMMMIMKAKMIRMNLPPMMRRKGMKSLTMEMVPNRVTQVPQMVEDHEGSRLLLNGSIQSGVEILNRTLRWNKMNLKMTELSMVFVLSTLVLLDTWLHCHHQVTQSTILTDLVPLPIFVPITWHNCLQNGVKKIFIQQSYLANQVLCTKILFVMFTIVRLCVNTTCF